MKELHGKVESMDSGLSISQWVQWLAATAAAAISMAAYAFATFDTKDHVIEVFIQVEKRLDRIEAKLDRILEKAKGTD